MSAENARHFYIPRGFTHGFLVLSETAIFSYKCDHYYHKESEGGILWNDSKLSISWPTIEGDIELSEKDKALPHGTISPHLLARRMKRIAILS